MFVAAALVEKAVQLAKYPPQGSRGVGLARAQGYGINFQQYVETANRTVAVVPQIEHIDAVSPISALSHCCILPHVTAVSLTSRFAITPFVVLCSLCCLWQVNDIEQIVKVPGVDCLQLGPYDLSASMGKVGQLDDPEVQAAIEHVRITCVEAGMPIGIFGVTADAVAPHIESGFTLITAGVDAMMLAQASHQHLEALRATIDSK